MTSAMPQTQHQTRFAPRQRFDWLLRDRTVALGQRTLVMGVLNVTPDSFSDGGLFAAPEDAIEHGLRMLDSGADILDVGGESTRPNALPVAADQELARILPVIVGILRERPNALLSVDTFKARVAHAAVGAGAAIVNDVSGFTWDAAMAAACADLGCGVVAMHTRGRPMQWRTLPPVAAEAVLPLVLDGLRVTLQRAIAAGMAAGRLVLDPGFGFGKADDENYSLLAAMPQLAVLGTPILAGISRKSFLGRTLAERFGVDKVAVAERDNATLAATVASVLAGAHIVRVHAVRPAVEAVAIADAVLRAA